MKLINLLPFALLACCLAEGGGCLPRTEHSPGAALLGLNRAGYTPAGTGADQHLHVALTSAASALGLQNGTNPGFHGGTVKSAGSSLLERPRRTLLQLGLAVRLDESPGTRREQQNALVSRVEEEDREAAELSKLTAEEVDEIAVSIARHAQQPKEGLFTASEGHKGSSREIDHPQSAYSLDSPEGAAREASSVAELARFRAFNISDPAVRAFSRLADAYLLPWSRIEGIAVGMGSRGMISPLLLEAMSHQSVILEGCAHIKVVDGKVFFRYGGFMYHWFRYRRLLQTVKMIQEAVDRFGLSSLRAEFFLNTRDIPMSFDNSLERHKAGYPVFSVERAEGSIDIVYPDPIDLSEGYTADNVKSVPWEKKEPRAVFRGATTNYPLKTHYNWRVNPRLRLHRMTDLRPDLVDARVMGFSQVGSRYTRTRMTQDQIQLAPRLSRDEMAKFKYEIVVDGAAGSSRTCSTIGGDQVMIKQQSQYSQFFAPLLRPYEHFIPTTHFFDDLFDQVVWARAHDNEAQEMVKSANEVARQACTWSGRTLYWAILLIKYSRNALENPAAVQAPLKLCRHKVNLKSITKPKLYKDLPPPPAGWPPTCTEEAISRVKQPPCTFYCEPGNLKAYPQIWIPSSVVDVVPRNTLRKFEH